MTCTRFVIVAARDPRTPGWPVRWLPVVAGSVMRARSCGLSPAGLSRAGSVLRAQPCRLSPAGSVVRPAALGDRRRETPVTTATTRRRSQDPAADRPTCHRATVIIAGFERSGPPQLGVDHGIQRSAPPQSYSPRPVTPRPVTPQSLSPQSPTLRPLTL